MNRRYDIVIAGGGMVGLSAACLLAAQDQLRVTVIDAGKEPEFDAEGETSLRVSAIAPGSVEILSRIGAWPGIRDVRVCPYRDMKVWDAAGSVDGPETLSFGAAEFAVSELGFIVENELIRRELMKSLHAADVTLRFETPVRSITREEYRFLVELECGEKLRPDLLVGADGAKSVVRASAGIAVRSWPYPQRAFVTCLEPELDHRQTAWQRFLPEGPIGMLPLSDGRISIVWSTTPDNAAEALEMTNEALSYRITAVTDGVLGKLTPVGPRGAYPLRAQHATRYVQDGMVLIGDAAHTVHPLAGQGVNLGLADADALARVVSAALVADENPGDLPTLRRYERDRKGANNTMLRFIDALNRLFSNRSTPLSRLRGVGMYLFNKSGPIRQRAVETALGIR